MLLAEKIIENSFANAARARGFEVPLAAALVKTVQQTRLAKSSLAVDFL
jgi:hypothetical protein